MPAERRLRVVSAVADTEPPDDAREGEAMLMLANAISTALDDIHDPDWRTALETTRANVARSGGRLLVGRRTLGTVPSDRGAA